MNMHARCLCGQPARPSRVALSDAAASRDPTGTLKVRRKFRSDLDGRWSRLKLLVGKAIKERFSSVGLNIQHATMVGQNPVEAFQSWLDEALKQVVLGYNGTWTGKYVTEGAMIGARRALEAVPISSVPRDRSPILRALVITELQGICEATSQQAVRDYANGLLAGRSASSMAQSIGMILNRTGRTRSRALTEFMVVRAHAAATLDVFRAARVTRVGTVAERVRSNPAPSHGLTRDAEPLFPSRKVTRAENKLRRKYAGSEVDVETAGDDLVCEECQDISDSGPYSLDEAESLIPAHPNAVLEGSTIASYGTMHEMVRAKFRGPAIHLRTSTKELTIGPNHPMLTMRGFIKARNLQEGDELLYDLRTEAATTSNGSRSDLKEMPFVENVFETFAFVFGGNKTRVATSKHNFHGDITSCYGEVDIVHPTLCLMPVFDPLGIEHFSELEFSVSNSDLKLLASLGAKESDLHTVSLSSAFLMRTSNLCTPPSLGHSGPLDSLLLRGRAQGDVTFFEDTLDDPSTRLVALSQDHDAIATGVLLHDLRPSPFVWLRILSHETIHFDGWAFDASTITQLYNNNGFIVHNCRCTFVPAESDDEFEDAILDYDPNQPRDDHGMWSSVGGAPMKSFSPPADWHGVEGQNHDIDEPPLPKLRQGYTYTDKTTGKTHTSPGQRLSSGVIMREPDGRTWLVKPTNGFGGYNYTFPKGGVEGDMHPQANAIKETWEETGLKARITGWAGDYQGDTSVTRMYHAERVGGHPKDKGWETEQVALAHPDDLHAMLNRSRDRKIAAHHIFSDSRALRDDYDPDEPRNEHGEWTSGGGISAVGAALGKKVEAFKSEKGIHYSYYKGNYGPDDVKGEHVLEVDHDMDVDVQNAAAKHGIALELQPQHSGNMYSVYTMGHAVQVPATQQPLKMSDLTKIGGKKGSNEGGVYTDMDDKGTVEQYYIKQPATPDHVTNELLTAKLYQLAGVRTMSYVPVEGGAHVATELQTLDKDNISKFNADERHEAQKDFAVHAWLANWDAAGTGGDNQVILNGKVHTVDTGGGLKYRAQGEPKGAAFGNEVTEFKSLRGLDPNVHAPDAAALYGNITDAQLIASVGVVKAIPDGDIIKTVIKNGGNMSLAKQLIARKDDLVSKAQALGVPAAPKTILGPNTTTGAKPSAAASAAAEVSPHKTATGYKKFAETGISTKNEYIKHMLVHGATGKQMKEAVGWPSMDVPGTAQKLGLTLSKTKIGGGQFHYKADVSGGAAPAQLVAPDKPMPAFGKKATATTGINESNVDKYAAIAKVAKPAPTFAPPTEAELTKAKKNVPLQMQYVPGAQGLESHPEAQKLLTAFNEKYAGKTLSEAELPGKVSDFKKLQANMVPLMGEQQKQAVLLASKTKAEQAAAHAKAVALQAEQKAAEKAAFEAKFNDPKVKEAYEKLHTIGVTSGPHLEKQYASEIKKTAAKGVQLTGADAAYIGAYRGHAYDALNENLWKGDNMSLKQAIYASELEKALDKMPSYSGYAQRGVQTSGAFERYANNVGHVVTEKGFSSYGAKHKLWGHTTIHLQAKDLKDIRTFNPGEGGGELILQKGSLIHITKVDPKTKEVWAEQV